MIILIADEYQRHFKYEYQVTIEDLVNELKSAAEELK
jgi:hypothetical protein